MVQLDVYEDYRKAVEERVDDLLSTDGPFRKRLEHWASRAMQCQHTALL